jgi:hypothetical protein
VCFSKFLVSIYLALLTYTLYCACMRNYIIGGEFSYEWQENCNVEKTCYNHLQPSTTTYNTSKWIEIRVNAKHTNSIADNRAKRTNLKKMDWMLPTTTVLLARLDINFLYDHACQFMHQSTTSICVMGPILVKYICCCCFC